MTADAPQRGLVLVVEDEPAIADLVRLYLTRDGFGVHLERDGTAGLAAARRLRPVACVLDIALPGLPGTEICRCLREAGDWTPVIFLTARDDEVDRIVGLELGADDYVTKPFSPRELVARVKAILRRIERASTADADAPISAGDLSIDAAGRRVRRSGEEVHLTPTEFDLLLHLARSPGVVFSRDRLLSEVWGYADGSGPRTVDTHIAALRRKVGADRIRTAHGVGYALEA